MSLNKTDYNMRLLVLTSIPTLLSIFNVLQWTKDTLFLITFHVEMIPEKGSIIDTFCMSFVNIHAFIHKMPLISRKT